MNNVYTLRGLKDTPIDTHVDKVQRQIIAELACRMGDVNCIRVSIDHLTALGAGANYRSVSQLVSYHVSRSLRVIKIFTLGTRGRPKVVEY